MEKLGKETPMSDDVSKTLGTDERTRPAVNSGALTWEDCDGSRALLTTDAETCGEGDAVAVLALTREVVQGGIYLTPQDARNVIAFLGAALEAGER